MIKALYTYTGPVDQGFTLDHQYPAFTLPNGGITVISDKGVLQGVGNDWWRLDSFEVDDEVIYTYQAPAPIPHDETDATLVAEVTRLRKVEAEALEALAAAQRQHEADLAEIARLRGDQQPGQPGVPLPPVVDPNVTNPRGPNNPAPFESDAVAQRQREIERLQASGTPADLAEAERLRVLNNRGF